VRAEAVARPGPLARIRSRAGRHPLLLSGAAGALAALAFAPLHLWPLLAGFAVLAHQLRRPVSPRHAFLLGWSFAFAHHLVGLYWIAIAFFTDARTFGPLAFPAVTLLCAALAIFPGLATLAVARSGVKKPVGLALLLAVGWTAAEVARSWFFPWNLIGYAWVGTPVAQLGAVIGVHGLSLIAVALGALPATLARATDDRSWRPLAIGLVLLALLWAGGAWRLGNVATESVDDVQIRIVQANVAQHHKWQPELRARWFQRHIDLSAAGGTPADVIVWPESATPYDLDREPLVRQRIAEVASEWGVVISGGERFDFENEPPRAWNSLFVIDRSGRLVEQYDKHNLVPFGEFLPFRPVLGRLGLGKLAGGSVDFQPGPGPVVLDLEGVPPFSPLICYEAIFSGGVVPDEGRPDWLLNITNDAWFGTSSGPYQHLAMARMRTIEEGLPLVRSANTGISAVIDPLGRVEQRLALGEMGTLDVALPAALPPTLFARFGHLGALLLSLVLLGLGILPVMGRHRASS
jgi:apolipoprotein N-acyltransferase